MDSTTTTTASSFSSSSSLSRTILADYDDFRDTESVAGTVDTSVTSGSSLLDEDESSFFGVSSSSGADSDNGACAEQILLRLRSIPGLEEISVDEMGRCRFQSGETNVLVHVSNNHKSVCFSSVVYTMASTTTATSSSTSQQPPQPQSFIKRKPSSRRPSYSLMTRMMKLKATMKDRSQLTMWNGRFVLYKTTSMVLVQENRRKEELRQFIDQFLYSAALSRNELSQVRERKS